MPVTSAVLKLFRTDSDLTVLRNIEVYGFPGNGTLNISDYSPFFSNSLGTFPYFNELTVDFDVTQLIVALQSQTNSDFAGIQIRWPNIDDQRFASFGQNNVPNSFPQLELTTVPIPAALPLFASALIGFGLMGYRKRKARKAA